MNRHSFLIVFFVFGIFLQANTDKTLRCAGFDIPRTLIPDTQKTIENHICQFIFDSLVVQVSDHKYKLSLAEEVDVSPDSLSYTFLLQKNIKWQDGRPLTARDIQFTVELLLNPESDNYSSVLHTFIDDVVFVAPNIVTITLTRPFYEPLSLFTFKILPQHAIQKNYVKNTDEFSQNPLGCGPYMYDSGLGGKNIILKRNPYFLYRKRPFFKNIIFRIYDSFEQVSRDLENGKIHIAYQISKQNLKNIKYIQNTNQKIHFLKFNYNENHRFHKLLNDPSFRLAILESIDRQAIIKKIFSQRKATVISGPFPSNSWFYDKNLALRRSKKGKLSEDFFEKNAHEKFELRVGCVNQQDVKKAQKEIVESLKKRGFYAKIVTEEPFDIYYDVFTFENTTDIIKLFSIQNKHNQYNHPRLRELLYELHGVLNPWAIQKISKEVHSFMYREIPFIFLWQLDSLVAYNTRIHNIKLHPNNLFNFPEDWKWK